MRPRDQVGEAPKQLAHTHAKGVECLDAELSKLKTSIGAVLKEYPHKGP